jgi:hypothetical protein
VKFIALILALGVSSLAFADATLINGQVDDTSTTTVPENDFGPIRMTTNRAEHVNLRNSSGTEIGTSSDPVYVNAFQQDSSRQTYSAGIASYAIAGLTTDFCTITGSATKTIKVKEASIETTGGGLIDNVLLLKRSTANTGGTSTTLTDVAHDSTNSAGTAIVRAYTANPTALGTLVGNIRGIKTNSPLTTSSTDPQSLDFKFGDNTEQAIVLRGTGEVLAFNLAGMTITSGNAACFFEWTEE